MAFARVLKTAATCAVSILMIDAASAADVCSPADIDAISTANSQLGVVIENTDVECVPAAERGKCAIICASRHSMTDDQRRSILVWLVGIVGNQINARGVARFSSVGYLDRDLANRNVHLTISAARAADIQRQAKGDRIDAKQVIAETMAGFVTVATKH